MPGLIAHWDHFARKLLAVRPITEGSMLGYALRPYPHRALHAPDGTVLVRRGEPVIELHIDSRLIAERTAGASAQQRVLTLRREMLSGVRTLATQVKTVPHLADVRGLWGLTLLYRPMALYGFTVTDLPPGLWRWLTTRYMRLLLITYHPDGEERLVDHEEELVAKEIFLGREELLRKFGGDREGRRQQGRSAE